MPKTIQIRDLDDEVYAALSRRAADEGVSVPELLRRHARRLAAQPSMRQWLRRVDDQRSDLAVDETLDVLDDLRGPHPA